MVNDLACKPESDWDCRVDPIYTVRSGNGDIILKVVREPKEVHLHDWPNHDKGIDEVVSRPEFRSCVTRAPPSFDVR